MTGRSHITIPPEVDAEMTRQRSATRLASCTTVMRDVGEILRGAPIARFGLWRITVSVGLVGPVVAALDLLAPRVLLALGVAKGLGDVADGGLRAGR